jgi:hypothetical protein
MGEADHFDLLPEPLRIAVLLRRFGYRLADKGLTGSAALCDRAAALLAEPEARSGTRAGPPTLEHLGADHTGRSQEYDELLQPISGTGND